MLKIPKKTVVAQTALLIIDAQNDFTIAGKQMVDGHEQTYEEGRLGVKDGYAVVNPINTLIETFKKKHCPIIASLDWHPQGHKSFASSHPGCHPHDTILIKDQEQHLWPDHCVQGSQGANFLPGLKTDQIDFIVRKGMDLFVDSYSAFFDNHGQNPTVLNEYLKSENVSTVVVTGIATDFCVKYTALDAQKLGYQVIVVLDACRGVDIDGSVQKAVEEMQASLGTPKHSLKPIKIVNSSYAPSLFASGS
jgi:nicotinamidase/pyrazinamidase